VTHHRRAIAAQDAPDAVGAYSHAIVSGGLLFCSGQIPLDPESGELIDGDAAAEASRCLENVDAVCAAAGAQLADAVRVTLYLTDLVGDFAAVNDAYAAFFSGADPPARVAVGVASLPKGASVEVDAVVALPD
jgi:2-iminobutanoate/2-iminopropanoate deaminase